MLHRFFIDPPGDATEVRLEGREYHHAVRVRRLRLGEAVEVIDPAGRCHTARVESIEKDAVVLTLTGSAPSRESRLELTLAQALIKPDNFELVLQKGTELGVTRFIPVISERVEVRAERVEKRHDRWLRIIEEAVKQSGRSVMPELLEPTRFSTILDREGEKVILDADAPRGSFNPDDRAVTLLIGPEGGFTEDEITLAKSRGCRSLGLGPRRMRAETAAIASVTLAQFVLGDLHSGEESDPLR